MDAAPTIDVLADPPRSAPAPPIIVRPPRARVAEPPAPPVEVSPSLEEADDEPAPGWGPAKWAVVLMMLAALAVVGGAALVRWGTPSRTGDTQAAATEPERAAPVATPATPSASGAGTPAPPSAGGPVPAAPAVTPTTDPALAPVRPPRRRPGIDGAPGAAEDLSRRAGHGHRAVVGASARGEGAGPGHRRGRTTAGALDPTGAEVFVDGTRRGVTPLAVRDLPLGAHAVRISRTGFTAAEQRVTLDAGRPSRAIDVTLSREAAAAPPVAASTPGSLVVESRPAGAACSSTAARPDARRSPCRRCRRATMPCASILDGYQPITTTTRVEPGARARVAVSLTLERPQ